MLHNLILIYAFAFLALVVPKSDCYAFDESGQRVIAAMAFLELSPEEQSYLLRILGQHPDLVQNLTTPEFVANESNFDSLWKIGSASIWPEVARGRAEWDRPQWHYQRGAYVTIGGAKAPPDINVLPTTATAETGDLHITQAITLNRNIWRDQSRPASERAIALCWLCHLVADIHHPLNTGSLYSPLLFPDGDARGTKIEVLGTDVNLHDVCHELLDLPTDPNAILDFALNLKNLQTSPGTSSVLVASYKEFINSQREVLDRSPMFPAPEDEQETARMSLEFLPLFIQCAEESLDLDDLDADPNVWIDEGRKIARLYIYYDFPNAIELFPDCLTGLVATAEKNKEEALPEFEFSRADRNMMKQILHTRMRLAGLRLSRLVKEGIE